jgi:hypothetical protein
MLSVCLYFPIINFWILEPVFMKLGMYIMAPEPVSHQSVFLYVYLYRCYVTAR